MNHKFECPFCGGEDVEVVVPVRSVCEVDFDEYGWPSVGDEIDAQSTGTLEWRCGTCYHEFTRGELQDIVTNSDKEET